MLYLSSLWFILYLIYPFQDISIWIKYLKPYYLIVFLIFYYTFILFLLKHYLSKVLGIIEFYIPFFLLNLWFFISLCWSVQIADSLYALLKYITYLLIGILLSIATLLEHSKIIRNIAYGIYLSGIIIGFLYFLKFITVGGLNFLTKAPSMHTIAQIASINVGFGGGRNLLASWESFSLTFGLIYILLHIKNKLLKYFLILTGLLPLSVIIITLSRTAILSILIFIILTFFLIKDIFIRKVIKVFAVIIIGFILAIFLLNPYDLSKFLLERFFLAFEALKGSGVDYGTLGRLELWNYAIKSIEASFLLGTGIGTLYKGLPEIGGVHNYHNIWLQFFAQTGFIGFLIFFIWSIWLFIVLHYLYKVSKKFFTNFKYLTELLIINIIIYYFKALLMFQYFDLEIWTLIGITGGLFGYIKYMRKCKAI